MEATIRSFTMIRPALWTSPDFRALSGEDRLLYLYYLSGPHQTLTGVSRVPDGYTSDDLGWNVQRCQDARRRLAEAGMIESDDDTNEVLITGWWYDNFPTNQSHMKGAWRGLSDVKSSRLSKSARGQLESEEQRRSAHKSDESDSPNESPSPNSRRLMETLKRRSIT